MINILVYLAIFSLICSYHYGSFMHLFIPSFIHSYTYSFIQSFIQSFINLWIHFFIHSHFLPCSNSISFPLLSPFFYFPERYTCMKKTGIQRKKYENSNPYPLLKWLCKILNDKQSKKKSSFKTMMMIEITITWNAKVFDKVSLYQSVWASVCWSVYLFVCLLVCPSSKTLN